MLEEYFKDTTILPMDFFHIPETEMQIAESIYKRFFNRSKLIVVQWTSCNITHTLNHFFDNVHSEIIDKLINDEEYHFCFQSDVEGWNMIQWYVPLCASAAAYGIPYNKLVFSTANLDVETQYETYAKRSGFRPPVKIIAYDHFLLSTSRFMEEIALDSGTFDGEKGYTLLDPEKYFDEMYKQKLTNDSNNIFLHLSRVVRNHRILFNYLADHSNYKKYYHLSQDQLPSIALESLADHTNISIDTLNKWNKKLPLTVDTNNFQINYGNLEPTFIDLFSNYLINIAGETNWSHNLFYSEKTYKPIGTMMPFLVYGNVGMNKDLKERHGFKLFENLFDYSWEDECNDIKRIEKLIAECDTLAERLDKYSYKDKVDIIMLQNKDIIIHNYETLLKATRLTRQQLITINL
jgi:hypothetical protein